MVILKLSSQQMRNENDLAVVTCYIIRFTFYNPLDSYMWEVVHVKSVSNFIRILRCQMY